MIKYILFLFLSIFFEKNIFAQVNCFQKFYHYGKLRFQKGQYQKAVDNFEAAKECNDVPSENDLIEFLARSKKCLRLLNDGNEKFSQKNYSEAKSCYLSILKINFQDSFCLQRAKFCEIQSLSPSEMVFVQGGKFSMGSFEGEINEKPVHEVSVKSFWMDKYEVTNAEFVVFLNEKGKNSENGNSWLDLQNENCKIKLRNQVYEVEIGFEKHPVLVSWFGAKAYSEWAGKRLPTEAEWEFAARGGMLSQNYKYSGSDFYNEVAWFRGNSGGDIQRVGTKKPNELGIFDLSGNVWEWCEDFYDENFYSQSERENPQNTKKNMFRILRGGGATTFYYQLRCAYRNFNLPETTQNTIGFRCVRD